MEHGSRSRTGGALAQFYAPALAVYAAAASAFVNLAISTALARDEGILKRVRGTPLPPWIYMAGRVCSSTWVAFLAIAVMIGAGAAFFEVERFGRTALAALITLIAGLAALSALGLMVAAIVPNGDATPAVTDPTLSGSGF